MSKSYRISLKGGDEQELLTRGRRYHRPRPGRNKAAKASYNRRQRRALKPTEDD